MWHEDGDVNRSVWILAGEDHVAKEDTSPYEVVEFPRGIFLVATAVENNIDDLNETVEDMMDWIGQGQMFSYGDFPP